MKHTKKHKRRGRRPGPLHYRIQQGVPVTMRASTRLNKAYPKLLEMKVWESFSFPLDERSVVEGARNFVHRTTKQRFIIRVISKNPPIGRIWRVEDGTVFKTSRKPKPAKP